MRRGHHHRRQTRESEASSPDFQHEPPFGSSAIERALGRALGCILPKMAEPFVYQHTDNCKPAARLNNASQPLKLTCLFHGRLSDADLLGLECEIAGGEALPMSYGSRWFRCKRPISCRGRHCKTQMMTTSRLGFSIGAENDGCATNQPVLHNRCACSELSNQVRRTTQRVIS